MRPGLHMQAGYCCLHCVAVVYVVFGVYLINRHNVHLANFGDVVYQLVQVKHACEQNKS